MTEPLKQILRCLSAFSEQELDEVVKCFKPRFVNKNQVLLREGDVCKAFYYVRTGCIRTFFIDKNGHEKTRYIMPENHIGTALTSFISQKPSVEFIEALDDTELLSISHSAFYRLNKDITNWKLFYQKILEMAYSFQNKKIEQLMTLTARQRYERILSENPILIQQVSNKVLASYLDMREETLSRLKSA